MTESKELRVPHEDLVLLAFTCQKCNAELTRDIRSAEQQTPTQMRCPFCREEFNEHLLESFSIFEDWYGRVKKSKQRITFRVPVT